MKALTQLAVAGALSLPASAAVSQQVSLRVWDTYAELSDQMDAVIAAFEEAHPDIDIVRDVQATEDMRAIIQTALNSGTGPDVLYYDTGRGYAGVLAENGLIMPLDDMYENGQLPEIFPWVRERTTFDGTTFGVGTGLEFIGVYYNKDMFAEMGLEVPQTYEEFLAICEALKDAGVFPMAFGNAAGWPSFHNFSAYVNTRVPPDDLMAMVNGEMSWDDPRIVEAIQAMFVDMVENEYLSPSVNAVAYEDANSLFTSGMAGMTLTGSWMIRSFKNTPFETGIFFLPSEDGENPRPPGGLGAGWFISAKTEHPEEAKEFLSFLFDPENAHYWLETLNEIPSYPVDTSGMDITPLLKFTLDVIANEEMGHSIDVLTPDTFNAVMSDGFQAVIAGDRTAQEQATALQAAMP